MLTFIWSPVRFFETRLAKVPNWPVAMAAPLLCALVDVAAVQIVSGKIMLALSQAQGGSAIPPATLQAARWSTLATVLGYPACFALSVLIMASIDTVTTESGKQRRYVDLGGLAFAAFVPGCLFALAAAMMWTPPPVFTSAAESLSQYARSIRADPWLQTSALLYHVGLLWYVALLAVILHLAGALPARVAALAALVMFISLGGFRLWQFLPPLTW